MSLRTFCLRIFQHCPLLASFSVENHTKAFEEFLQYKTRVPVRGAIMLNHAMDSVVLVKGWKKGANWSFPRGKINKDEDDLDCAVREVYEETGLDLREAGLVPTEKKPKYIEISMREQQLRLYVFRDVPMDTNFQPRTRKEISKIEWYKLSQLPAFRKKGAQNEENGAGTAANKFYMVAPFLVPLKKWIVQQKRKDAAKAASNLHLPVQPLVEEVLTEEETATQTDVPTGPSASVPSIDTYEGATRELQRLLKMQPAAAQGQAFADRGIRSGAAAAAGTRRPARHRGRAIADHLYRKPRAGSRQWQDRARALRAVDLVQFRLHHSGAILDPDHADRHNADRLGRLDILCLHATRLGYGRRRRLGQIGHRDAPFDRAPGPLNLRQRFPT